jgi:acetyl-CoA carboxylase carboxyltransferase component
MTRVMVLGDPSREMGALAEPECLRIAEAINLAEKLNVPIDWFPVSSGAKISMDVGTEGLDWVARVLRRLIEFTQAGGEVNIVVAGVSVGGQSYWNAEATMLMHTRGILIMTPQGSMVLTGKRALDYSGGVSAETNQGIGGFERIMGVNGQGQYAARDIAEACHILFRHYDHTYVAPGERFPRRARTYDTVDRDVRGAPHRAVNGTGFDTVGDVFSLEKNPGRKKPFDIRSIMRAVVDQDHEPFERWLAWRNAETAVVWDAHLGGIPVCLLGIESRPLPRFGVIPGDGPATWTGGTLFPQSSKKVAKAINSASGNRPVVVLANLSGFDGSPESMRELQLEYGAEIGRAVVNFDGPMVFVVVSRYHGGAYVVFSCTLNDNLQVAAVEGSHASVIGGAPAAAVVFPAEVKSRTMSDPRVKQVQALLTRASEHEKPRLSARHDEVFKTVYSEKQGEVADYFDRIHSVQRAQQVGSLHEIIQAQCLRPYLVRAVELGIAKVTSSAGVVSEREPVVMVS